MELVEIIFGVDRSSSPYNDNEKKDILIPGNGPIQGLGHKLAAEKMYSITLLLWIDVLPAISVVVGKMIHS